MYISEKQIVTSFANLAADSRGQKLNTFIGLVMFFIHGERKRNNYYAVNMKEVSVHLDNVLYLRLEKPTRDSDKTWFGYFHTAESIKAELLAGKTISAEDFAVALYWNRDFDPETNLVEFLRAEIKNDDFFDTIFKVEKSIEIAQPTIADIEALYSILGGTQTNFTYSVDDAKFLSKPAGDLKGAPFAQTLDTQARQSFIVTDFDFIDHYNFNGKIKTNVLEISSKRRLPKPFLLLAGISGTGKSRFVREQAQRHDAYPDNFKSIAVRPDWHEPSDLLGYVTRISGETTYAVPELLKFIVSSWKNAASSADEKAIQYHSIDTMVPYWLCLDEMNLAPVEQYFADYLSVLESRKWETGIYRCDALLSADVIRGLKSNAQQAMQKELGLDGNDLEKGLWNYFRQNGIPLPPNLIVAGTVNMDETTHGFSRKVIDRAFTIDFGAFYPNDLDQYFVKAQFAKTLSFPLLSAVSQFDLAEIKDSDGNAVDANGVKSIAFLADLNSVLKDTPFELAYRSLNELLMAVVCFQPANEQELQAVWDDFLMTKVLPRIDGDADKLKDRTPDADKSDPDASLLKQLETVLEQQLKMIWNDAECRPDLLRVDKDDKPFNIACRAKKKLKWMRDRLKDNGFTTFWP